MARTEREGELQISLEGLERLEARYLVQKVLASQGFTLPRAVLEGLLDSSLTDFSIKGAALRLDGFLLSLNKSLIVS
jgi:hypothetical protein